MSFAQVCGSLWTKVECGYNEPMLSFELNSGELRKVHNERVNTEQPESIGAAVDAKGRMLDQLICREDLIHCEINVFDPGVDPAPWSVASHDVARGVRHETRGGEHMQREDKHR